MSLGEWGVQGVPKNTYQWALWAMKRCPEVQISWNDCKTHYICLFTNIKSPPSNSQHFKTFDSNLRTLLISLIWFWWLVTWFYCSAVYLFVSPTCVWIEFALPFVSLVPTCKGLLQFIQSILDSYSSKTHDWVARKHEKHDQ